MKVHILVTCRKRELFRASTLVFESLRTGFPTADIVIHPNSMRNADLADLCKVVRDTLGTQTLDGVEYRETKTIHHEWIEHLVETEREPFWICDTDQIFWSKVEDWRFGDPLAGRLIPQWFNEYCNCIDRPRLHTSLMWIDAPVLRRRIADYRAQFPKDVFNPAANLFHPVYLPIAPGTNLFMDTCCLLYQALGGTAFTAEQLDAYTHMNFGTIEDLVLPRLKDGKELARVRADFLAHPANYRGAWRAQEEYYRSKRA